MTGHIVRSQKKEIILLQEPISFSLQGILYKPEIMIAYVFSPLIFRFNSDKSDNLVFPVCKEFNRIRDNFTSSANSVNISFFILIFYWSGIKPDPAKASKYAGSGFMTNLIFEPINNKAGVFLYEPSWRSFFHPDIFTVDNNSTPSDQFIYKK